MSFQKNKTIKTVFGKKKRGVLTTILKIAELNFLTLCRTKPSGASNTIWGYFVTNYLNMIHKKFGGHIPHHCWDICIFSKFCHFRFGYLQISADIIPLLFLKKIMKKWKSCRGKVLIRISKFLLVKSIANIFADLEI